MISLDNQAQRISGAYPSQVAGAFYTADADELRRQVEGYLSEAKSRAHLTGRRIVGLISPHAGYQYSGPIAGEAFAQVRDGKYHTVVVMALNHRRGASKLALLDRPAYDTPLGSLPLAQDASRRLAHNFPHLFALDEQMFNGEHSLEVELPFVQVALPEARVIPIIVAAHDPHHVASAGRTLFEEFGRDHGVLFVMSSDLSHFFSYEQAVELDNKTLSLLEDWNIDRWKKKALSAEGMCGYWPILTYASFFEQFPAPSRQVSVLDYRNSGDTSGSKDGGVVGYGAVAFSIDEDMEPAVNEPKQDEELLSRAARTELMGLAKEAVRAAAHHEHYDPPEPVSEQIRDLGAAFVTLKKNGELRGCIGHVVARVPLYRCVADVALSAAVHDTRFSPVSAAELSELTFEISVLTPPQPTTPEQVVVGRDGLIVSGQGRSGLLLPQVPLEWGWDREEFLSRTCQKAGLPLDSWRKGGVELQSFRAIVFGEEDF